MSNAHTEATEPCPYDCKSHTAAAAEPKTAPCPYDCKSHTAAATR